LIEKANKMTTKIKLSGTLQLWASVATQQGDSLEAKILREAAMQLEAGEALVAHLDMLLNGINSGVPIPEDGAAVTAAREAIKAWKGDQ
jgi:hypothetical protein